MAFRRYQLGLFVLRFVPGIFKRSFFCKGRIYVLYGIMDSLFFYFIRCFCFAKKYPRIPESDAGVSLSSMRSVCGLFSALRYENKIKVVCF